jgi:integration host factor subunit beta
VEVFPASERRDLVERIARVPEGAIQNLAEHISMTDTTVTKADLVEEVVRVTELPRKESEAIVETIFEGIIGALQGGDRIEIRGFGSFRTRQRRGRTGRNPKTGAKVEVPPKRIPFFKPSKELKDHINGGATPAPGTGASPAGPRA